MPRVTITDRAVCTNDGLDKITGAGWSLANAETKLERMLLHVFLFVGLVGCFALYHDGRIVPWAGAYFLFV